MKRFIRVVALFMVLVCAFTAVVSADDFSNTADMYNLLDYTYIFGDSNTASLGNGYVTVVPLPELQYVRYIEFVVFAHKPITSVTINGTAMDVVPFGVGGYRVFGKLWSRYSELEITWGFDTTAQVQVYSFYVSSAYASHFAETGTMTVGSSSYTMSSSTTKVTHNFPNTGTSGHGQSFRASFSSSNWKKYDYLDFYIRAWVGSVDSISCSFAGVSVPCSTSYISSDDWEFADYYNVLVRVDLRGLDRTKTDVPLMQLSGVYEIGQDQFIDLIQVNGYAFTDADDPYTYWLSRLFESQKAYFDDVSAWNQAHEQFLLDRFAIVNQALSGISSSIVSMTNTLKVSIDTAGINIVDKLTSVQNGIVSKLNAFQTTMVSWFTTVSDQLDQLLHPDTSNSQEFEDDIASQATEMEDISETLDSVTKPPVEDLDPSVDDIVSPADVENYTSILGILLANNIFLSVCLMSFTLALVSYTLYGKR